MLCLATKKLGFFPYYFVGGFSSLFGGLFKLFSGKGKDAAIVEKQIEKPINDAIVMKESKEIYDLWDYLKLDPDGVLSRMSPQLARPFGVSNDVDVKKYIIIFLRYHHHYFIDHGK